MLLDDVEPTRAAASGWARGQILMAIELDVFWNVLWSIEALYQASQDFTIKIDILAMAVDKSCPLLRGLPITQFLRNTFYPYTRVLGVWLYMWYGFIADISISFAFELFLFGIQFCKYNTFSFTKNILRSNSFMMMKESQLSTVFKIKIAKLNNSKNY